MHDKPQTEVMVESELKNNLEVKLEFKIKSGLTFRLY